MNITRVCFGILLVLSAACGDPVTPTPPPGPVPRPFVPPPPMVFPAPTGPSRTFVFAREASSRVSEFTRNSRVLLYDNGAFELQYLTIEGGRLRGVYRDAGSFLMILFEGADRTVETPWNDASATLESDFLTLSFSERMLHSDFENAVYVRIP